MLSGTEMEKYAKRRGLCHICGQYQTHRRVGIFRQKLEPLTVKKGDTITVYKGYCIQPTCYQSVHSVKGLLGERVTRRTQQHAAPGLVAASSSSGSQEHEPKQAPQASPPPPPAQEQFRHEQDRPNRTAQFGRRNERRTDQAQLQHTPPRMEHGERVIPEERVTRAAQSALPPRSSRNTPMAPRTNYTQAAPEPPQEDRRDFRESGRMNRGHELRCSLNSLNGHGSIIGIQRLECLAKDGNFVDFFVRLENDGTTPDVVLHAFQVLQEQLIKHHQTRPNGLVLSGGGWVKTVDDKITKFKKERSVVLEGLKVFLTICEQPYNYRILIVRKGAVEVILARMEDYSDDNEVMELACIILDCLTKNTRDKLNANHAKAVSVIRRMVQVVLHPNSPATKTMALSTLYNLSKQKTKCEATGKNLLYSVHQSLAPAGEAFADAAADTLMSKDLSQDLAGPIVSLIWKVSCGHEESREGNPNLATEKLVNTLLATVQRFDSRVILEACCGAFANLPLKPSFSVMQTEVALFAVCEGAQKSSGFWDSRFALCTVHAICNLLSDPARRDAAMRLLSRACRLVLELMENFPENQELAELGCSVVGQLSCDSRRNLEAIVAEGRSEVLIQAFRNMFADRDTVSLELKESVLTAILAWSGCDAGVRQLVNGSVLDSVNVLLHVEADPSILNILEMITVNCQPNPLQARQTPSYGEILRRQPEMFAILMQDAESDETSAVSLVQALRGSGAVERVNYEAFEALVSTMSKLRNSEDFQSETCVLLSEAIQRGVEACRIICRNGLAVVVDALGRHGDNPDIAEHGCYVIVFILRHCDPRQLASVRTSLAGALVSIMGGQEGARAASAAMNLFAECVRHDSYFLETGSHPSTIRKVVSSMNMYLESGDLQRTGCSFLRILCNDDHAKEVIGREGGVTAVMASMMVHGESPAVCSVALASIRRLSMVPANKALIAQNGGIDAILEYVGPQMGNPEIVSCVFTALNNVAAEPETRSVAEVGDGVILLLNDSMSRFPNDEQVQKNACFLIKSFSYRPSNLHLMHRHSRTLIPLLTRAAEVFPEHCRVIATSVVNRLRAH
jgi:hypothetical protein